MLVLRVSPLQKHDPAVLRPARPGRYSIVRQLTKVSAVRSDGGDVGRQRLYVRRLARRLGRKVDEWKTIVLLPSGDQLGMSAFMSAGTSCRRSLPLALTTNNVDWQPPFLSGPMPCLAKTSWVPSGDHRGNSLLPFTGGGSALNHGI